MKSFLEVIKKVADNENVTITNFERNLGASKGVFSRALSNNTDIQSKWILKLVENYPQYNPDWLLTGRGEMLRSGVEKVETTGKKDIKSVDLEKKLSEKEAQINKLLEQLAEKDKQVSSLIEIISSKLK